MNGRMASDASNQILMELARLRNAVARELHAQLAMRGEIVELADVPEVAYAVAVQLGREFRIQCHPLQCHELDDDESLGPDSAAFYGSALPAGDNERSSDRYPIFDHGWPARI
jgi:hypothetical protein